jgi:hypothetical protein
VDCILIRSRSGGQNLFDSLYEFLAGIGYGHPLHPMFVHRSAGVPTAALLLALAALVSKRSELARSARHCIIIAFISIGVRPEDGYGRLLVFTVVELPNTSLVIRMIK